MKKITRLKVKMPESDDEKNVEEKHEVRDCKGKQWSVRDRIAHWENLAYIHKEVIKTANF